MPYDAATQSRAETMFITLVRTTRDHNQRLWAVYNAITWALPGPRDWKSRTRTTRDFCRDLLAFAETQDARANPPEESSACPTDPSTTAPAS